MLKSLRIVDALYTVEWYLFSQKQKRIYHIFLQDIQRPSILHVLHVLPLNMETCVAVSNIEYC